MSGPDLPTASSASTASAHPRGFGQVGFELFGFGWRPQPDGDNEYVGRHRAAETESLG